ALVTQDTFCRETLEKLAAAADELRHAQNRCDAVVAEMGRIKDSLSSLKEGEQLLDRSAPARWRRMLATNPARQHRQDVVANARKQLDLRKALAECEHRLAKAEKPALERALRGHDQAEWALRSRRKIWIAKTEELARLGEILDQPAAPEHLTDLDSDQVQIDGLWHGDELAALRSALFEAALTLHE
ncbi:hypothetical protein ACE04B_41935, partial [Rhizobium phaseoli]